MQTKKAVYKKVHCDSCDVLVINNVICHESGCPDAWKDKTRECRFCGCDFKPEYKEQYYCNQKCYNADMGYPDDELTDLDLLPDGND